MDNSKYQRIKVIGAGAFGKAYLVKNTEANALCVVKQMETTTMDSRQRNEAVKEALVLKRMVHPNIIQFQDVFMTKKGRLCIVMEYADGGDVHTALRKRQGDLLPEQLILEWFVQTCFALLHVHEKKVLHRDLKTHNIFLMQTGQIKLGDFGVARVLEATKDYVKTMVGTPYYLSPEIIQERPYSFKSDVWSCGIVLFELATLRHPFDAGSLVDLAGKILREQIPAVDSTYSNDLNDLIRRMLSKSQHARPKFSDILCLPYLQASMKETNEKYELGLDLSVFKPVVMEQANGSSDVGLNLASGADESGTVATEGGDSFDRGAAFEEESSAESADGSDTEPPMQSLARSARNLKLTTAPLVAAATAASATATFGIPGVKSDSDLCHSSSARERSENADGIGKGVKEERHRMTPVQTGGSEVGAKADLLRKYLVEQLSDSVLQKALAIVQDSGSRDPAKVEERVEDCIGADKTKVLLPMIQLLCFLEEVAGSLHGADSTTLGIEAPRGSLQEQIVTEFKAWDANGDGVICADEFRRVLNLLGMGEDQVAKTFVLADLNKDGKVNYKEFVNWLFSETVPRNIGKHASIPSVKV
eukprot:TRINITY_DN33880_c0_g1_i1.p1 TRINITY_DN33880_c0_g1~~TRINITY_DN33880_c0_g1_i1.p1  ORF type:complete len:590 (-),score=118.63 TRINITY_DN33880_c0_g1_i1:353-2122(-)